MSSVLEKLNVIQKDAQQAVLRSLKDSGRALLVMPTGTGKTNTAIQTMLEILKSEPIARFLWITHTNELLAQTEARMRPHFKLQTMGRFDAEERDTESQIILSSIPTLSRKNHLEKFGSDDFNYILVDEAHHTPASSWTRILNHFKGAKRFGLTATPYRPDGQELVEFFGQPCFHMKFSEGQTRGVLAQDEGYTILTDSVLAHIVTKNGEYSPKALERLHTSKRRNQVIVESYLEYGRAKMIELGMKPKAICYCVNVAHAKRMAKLFAKAGITSAYIVGNGLEQTVSQRIQVWNKFTSGHSIEILCAVNILNEGVDVPDVGCVLMVRPTRSNILYQQQVGRAARATAKSKFIVLDYVDNIRREWQTYTIGTLTKKSAAFDRVITKFLDEKDPVALKTRIENVIAGVETWENQFKHSNGYWMSKEACHKAALNCESRTEFSRKYVAAYVNARRFGWIEDICSHMPHQRKSRTLQECMEIAALFKSRTEWSKGDRKTYNFAYRNRWLDRCCGHMPEVVRSKKRTLEDLKEIAKQYNTRSEWCKKDKLSYTSASARGALEECCVHMPAGRRKGKYTLEECIRAASRFTSRSEWANSPGGSYVAAKRNGWIEPCCSHMGAPRMHPRSIINIDTGEIFESGRAAAKTLSVSPSSIVGAIKRKTRSRGYRLEYYDEALHGHLVKKKSA